MIVARWPQMAVVFTFGLIVSFIFLSNYISSSSLTARLNVQNVSSIPEDTCGFNFIQNIYYLTVI